MGLDLAAFILEFSTKNRNSAKIKLWRGWIAVFIPKVEDEFMKLRMMKTFFEMPSETAFRHDRGRFCSCHPEKTCISTYWDTWTLSTQDRVFVRVKQACYPQIFAIPPLFDHFPSIFHDFNTITPHSLMEKDLVWKNMVKSGLSLLDLSLHQPFFP